MAEIISVNEVDISKMGDEALQFFADEIRQKNTVLVIRTSGAQLEIKTQRDWDDFLKNCGAVKVPEKKNYRI